MGKESEHGDGEEEYIDMEIMSYSSPPSKNTREFEFQIQNSLSSNHERESNTFPAADDLFYKGKLLPLNLLSTTTLPFDITKSPLHDYHNYYYPLPLTAPCTNTANTPLDSSPSESCRASCELNPDDYFFQWSSSTELSGFITNRTSNKHLWSKKMKLIKHSIISQKLKASRAYLNLKSLFTKSSCSDEQSKSNRSISSKKKPSYPTIASIIKNIDRDCSISHDDNNQAQRRSFSSAIKRHSPTKCLSSSSSSSNSSSSSSSSVSSNGGNEMQVVRRNSSATEIEGSIEAAIAHCKKSQFDSISGFGGNGNSKV